MPAVEIKPDIYWVGVNDRTTDLFEGLWPISREGVSYNSYLIKDEKTAIVDLAKAMKTDDFFGQIADITELRKIDYAVINHVEPDHTGVLRILKAMAPDMTIVCTQKAADLLESYYGVHDNMMIVGDGDTLSLGKRTLHFVSTPFVHWPETMMTYEPSEGILFSCDGFGGYGALQGSIFDDECQNQAFYERESLRYFVNIVAKFRVSVRKAINKLADVDVRMIAPSHGLIWRAHPERIIELYQTWCNYPDTPGDLAVTLIYGSMYGNTESFMNAVAQGVVAEGLDVEIFDAARTHSSYMLPYLWTRRGVVVGAPTYEGALFPPVWEVIREARIKGVKNRQLAMFGSYGWTGGALRDLVKIVEPVKWNLIDSLEVKGGANPESIARAEAFGRTFAQTLKADASAE
ncbi:MAG: FprA family A-type flavoprotein [Verrucomicrobia bacterium]|jgi:anaerobic nitric oxide reductase flavorubredoxin|nr:FprA family A-type flavoprotein [Verrucomicrobiota bacterium]MBT7700585.1 FprA family A-type flavoprotein [Verrucomicrobiota bacterium]